MTRLQERRRFLGAALCGTLTAYGGSSSGSDNSQTGPVPDKPAAGRPSYSHSGAFGVGAATDFVAVPSTGLAIVALTNGYPIGIPETLTAQFFDLVQFGSIQRDWGKLYADAFAPMLAPEGSLVGAAPPKAPLPARVLSTYTGAYRND